VKMPRFMMFLEDRIKKTAAARVIRGKTDIYINFESSYEGDVEVIFNENLADSYMEKVRQIEERYGVTSPDKLTLVARYPDVITSKKAEEDMDVIWETLLPALNEALDKFIEMREAEGENLKKDILVKNDNIAVLLKAVEEKAPLVAEEYRQKLMQRLAGLLDETEIDEQRILTEVTIFADKACIDEEITRLKSHIDQLKNILENGGQVGRKLDFLVQEMNREANTIGSKSNNIDVTKKVVEIKSEIEKIREQVQNIE
ncbi:MAG: YicC family protein, partial [Firmicutes bacterium]|nr:YicC family protein [Bacillota bacterium]